MVGFFFLRLEDFGVRLGVTGTCSPDDAAESRVDIVGSRVDIAKVDVDIAKVDVDSNLVGSVRFSMDVVDSGSSWCSVLLSVLNSTIGRVQTESFGMYMIFTS